MDLAHEPAFQLGRIEIRPSTREVVFPGGDEIVEPRVMAVLLVLARAGGKVITRDELVLTCWDGRIVSDDAINRVISRVRKISDLTDGQDFTLETITKVGYRLRVAGSAPAAASEPAAAEPAPSPKPKLDRRVLIGGGLAAAAVAAIGGTFAWNATRSSPPSKADELYRRAIEIGATDNAQQVAQSIAFLREAVSLAPNHTDAWAALALAYVYSFQTSPPERYKALDERAHDAAGRALALDGNNGDANAALALLPAIYQNWQPAEKGYRDALARHPRSAPVNCALADLLAATGRNAEAVPASEKALDQQPLIARRHYELAQIYWFAGRLDAADRTIDKARDLWPLDVSIWFGRLYQSMYGGDVRRALGMLADLNSRPPGIPASDYALVESVGRALDDRTPASRTAAIEQNLAAARKGLGYARNVTILASALGDLDAVDEATNAYFFDKPFVVEQTYFSREQGEYRGVRSRETSFLFHPVVAPYRADPRFAKLVEAVGLDAYWRAAGVTPDFRKSAPR
jgi:DNA-binding winged helix-turn-helix (wHTH) protein/tetratricopeptide (TPR) repeat protein